jgi:hypothetical protein
MISIRNKICYHNAAQLLPEELKGQLYRELWLVPIRILGLLNFLLEYEIVGFYHE